MVLVRRRRARGGRRESTSRGRAKAAFGRGGGVHEQSHQRVVSSTSLWLQTHNVVAYPFYGYWEDIGTVKSFFEENLKLTRHPAEFEFYDPQSPIYTSPRVLPPATVENCRVTDAIIAQVRPGGGLRFCSPATACGAMGTAERPACRPQQGGWGVA